jgi:uncharacterized membrane protein (UPF0136 family)
MKGGQRPQGITVLAVLMGLGGVMDLQNFFWFFIDPHKLLFSSIEALKWFNFYVSLPIGALSLIVGYMFIKGVGWGRSLGIVTSLLGIIINSINLTISRTFSPIIAIITIINVTIIYYLRKAAVKKYFTTL